VLSPDHSIHLRFEGSPSSFGSPLNNSDKVIPKASAIFESMLRLGLRLPNSSLLRYDCSTLIISASFAWVRPFSLRSVLMRLPSEALMESLMRNRLSCAIFVPSPDRTILK